jgi:hypothetical protein
MKKLILSLFIFIGIFVALGARADTFGYTTAGSSYNYVQITGSIFGSNFTSPSNVSGATISGLTMSIAQDYGGGGNCKAVIYTEAYYGKPATLITNAVGGEVAFPSSKAWATSSFSTSPALNNNTAYLLALIYSGDNSARFYYNSGAENQECDNYANNYSIPAPIGEYDCSSFNSIKYSIYATYTAGEAAARRIIITE